MTHWWVVSQEGIGHYHPLVGHIALNVLKNSDFGILNDSQPIFIYRTDIVCQNNWGVM